MDRNKVENVLQKKGSQEVFEKYIGFANRTNAPTIVSLHRHTKREDEQMIAI